MNNSSNFNMAEKKPLQSQPIVNNFPVVSFPDARAQAKKRRENFAYKFPKDSRHLGGDFSVKECGELLLRFCYFERRLSHAIGAWTLSIPEFEVLGECGRHIFYHADAARTLRERLSEQEMKLHTIDAYRNEEIDRFMEELLSAEDTPAFLAGSPSSGGKGS